jgi:MinD-like ATPase involved in chromosome partitioning or flagellar assembly
MKSNEVSTNEENPNATNREPRAIAIVSGKGGSGKTTVAVAMAQVLDTIEIPTLVVDADSATGGMTYFLGLKHVRKTAVGLTEVFLESRNDLLADAIQTIKGYKNAKFLGIGNHRRLYKEKPEGLTFSQLKFSVVPTSPNDSGEGDISTELRQAFEEHNIALSQNATISSQGSGSSWLIDDGRQKYEIRKETKKEEGENDKLNIYELSALNNIFRQFQREGRWIIFDCRGGIDSESLEICRFADEILMVVEPDTTSFQATEHLVDVLRDNELTHKLIGFAINKTFANPNGLIRQGQAVFGCKYLYAIPLDVQPVKDFYVGNVPALHSLFSIHLWQALHEVYDAVPAPKGRIWNSKDFGAIAMADIDSLRGGIVISSMIFILGIIFTLSLFGVAEIAAFNELLLHSPPRTFFVMFGLGLMGSISGLRRWVGRLVVGGYERIMEKLGFR